MGQGSSESVRREVDERFDYTLALMQGRSRLLFQHYAVYYGISAVGLTALAIKRRKILFMAPLVPQTCIGNLLYDAGYGTFVERAKNEAAKITKK